LDLLTSIQDAGVRNLLQKIFSGETLERFCTAPAARKMHHAYLHGLLEHTLSVCGLAGRIADHYPSIDRDLLLAGALLHDIAKIKEFSYERPPFDYTTQGRLLGHLVLGSTMVMQAAQGIRELSSERLDQVVHLIVSHHGRYEFGSPVLPMTREALLLHHVDDMDAKMQYCDDLAEQMEEPGWTDYQRPLERFLYLQSKQPSGTEKVGENVDSGQQLQAAKEREEQTDEQRSSQQRLF
jgi:3'-5' exoribonuclease